jgi:hypothetical protein
MNSRAENFYAAWRERCRAGNLLRDGDSAPPEKLLQAVWQHQRIRRDELKTADGKSVRVLHPGFASAEGGPDFRGAVLQFENAAPVSGDVEVDLQSSGWRAHGHDQNPNFKKVILHVVWNETGTPNSSSARTFPPATLPLKIFLDSSPAELALALENESGLPENLRGKCSAPLRELAEPPLSELLRAAATIRFQNKADAMLARARHCGWEQALWENAFRALGYKHNIWPMQHLAEQKSRLLSGLEFKLQLASPSGRLKPELQQLRRENLLALQARLLGVSGLLPDDLTRAQKSSDTYLRRAWDFWWRDRDAFADCTLPRAVWKFHGLRPANHPQRRLALAAHWLADESFVSKIEAWAVGVGQASRLSPISKKNETGATPVLPRKITAALLEIFQVERDEFWSWHWTFNSARMARPQPLLGEARVTDLAVNVVLPWLWIRAREGGNEKILREVEQRFFAWPAAEDNSILKLARQRLLGTANARILKGAAEQQGLMQIVRDFCEHSNAVCADCRFPELVAGFKLNVAG